jgi:hypothetical protein
VPFNTPEPSIDVMSRGASKDLGFTGHRIPEITGLPVNDGRPKLRDREQGRVLVQPWDHLKSSIHLKFLQDRPDNGIQSHYGEKGLMFRAPQGHTEI